MIHVPGTFTLNCLLFRFLSISISICWLPCHSILFYSFLFSSTFFWSALQSLTHFQAFLSPAMMSVFELFSSPSLLAGSFYRTLHPSPSPSPSPSSFPFITTTMAPLPTSSFSSSSSSLDDLGNQVFSQNRQLESMIHDPNIDVEGLEECYKIILQTGKVSMISFGDRILYCKIIFHFYFYLQFFPYIYCM